MSLHGDYQKTFSASKQPTGPLSTVSRVATEALGTILVAVVLALVGAWVVTRDLALVNSHTLTVHAEQLQAIEEFHDQGARFTPKDAEPIKAEITALEKRLEVSTAHLGNLEARCVDQAVQIARLPPVQWQARIVTLERDVSRLAGKLDN